jgi:ketosteroid isomerase-like protein
MEVKVQNTTREVVEFFFKSVTERNLEELVSLFSENVDWYVPGDENKGAWLGKRKGNKAVADYYELLWKNTTTITAQLDHIFVDKDDAVITGELSTTMIATGKPFDSLFFIRMHVEHGKITKYRLLEDSYAASQSLTK